MGGLTIEQAKQVIKVAISVNQPILIHGAPGVGKTAFVKALAEELNMKFIDIRPSQTPSEEITGVGNFVVDKNGYKRFEKTLPTIFPTDKDIKAILFIDELTNCQKDVQDVLMSVINERSLGATFYNGEQYKLPDGVAIVAACNDSDTSINANELSQPLKNRFGHIYITDDTTELADGWLKWAKNVGINQAVIEYIKKNKDKIYERDKLDNEEMIYLTPRSWEAVSKILNKYNFQVDNTESIISCIQAYTNDRSVASKLVRDNILSNKIKDYYSTEINHYFEQEHIEEFLKKYFNLEIISNTKKIQSKRVILCNCSGLTFDRVITNDKQQRLAYEMEYLALYYSIFFCINNNDFKHNYVLTLIYSKIDKSKQKNIDEISSSYNSYNCEEEEEFEKKVAEKYDLIHEQIKNKLKLNYLYDKLIEDDCLYYVMDSLNDAYDLIDNNLFIKWNWLFNYNKGYDKQLQELHNNKFKDFLKSLKKDYFESNESNKIKV